MEIGTIVDFCACVRARAQAPKASDDVCSARGGSGTAAQAWPSTRRVTSVLGTYSRLATLLAPQDVDSYLTLAWLSTQSLERLMFQYSILLLGSQNEPYNKGFVSA